MCHACSFCGLTGAPAGALPACVNDPSALGSGSKNGSATGLGKKGLIASRSTCALKERVSLGPLATEKQYAPNSEAVFRSEHDTAHAQERKMADLSVLAFTLVVGAIHRLAQVLQLFFSNPLLESLAGPHWCPVPRI